MQTIIYSSHDPISHKLITERIKREKPKLYLEEASEILAPAFDAFLTDKKMNFEGLTKLISEKGWLHGDQGSDQIYNALRDINARIVPIESDPAIKAYLAYQAEHIAPLLYDLVLDSYNYAAAKDHPPEMSHTFLVGLPGAQKGPAEVISSYESKLQQLLENLKVFVGKELERDKHLASRVKELAEPDMMAYLGMDHRNVSDLLEAQGVLIPHEFIGDVAFTPEERLCMLLKYEKMGLDTARLRSSNPLIECDPAKKDEYLELIPFWEKFAERNCNRFSTKKLVEYFFKNLDKMT